ncbi:MAG: diiron oxygenase [Saprospiraceae bacterium]|nr:diiron oxygenase [Saprospiraceae bacterium]
MKKSENYPQYLTYQNRKLQPSVLTQEYPLPALGEGEIYYPKNEILLPFFTTEKELQQFGAAQFCTFLSDTIEVEHFLVIPAISSLRRIPFKIPPQPKLDLFKTATDEGYHAEQSLAYLTALVNHFDLPQLEGTLPALFIRRLEQQRLLEPNPVLKDLITIINGIVTETRISIELSKFAINKELSPTVRRICLTHAQDEVIQSSQFQALGKWLWEDFDNDTKALVSSIFIKSTIARSLPDLDSIIASISKATGRTITDASHAVLSRYNEEFLINEMLIAAKPTLQYLEKLGIGNYVSVNASIELEKRSLGIELERRKKLLNVA